MTATIVVGYPLDETREEARHEFPAGTNLAEALMEISPDRFGGMTFEVFLGSVSLATRVPQENAPDYTLEEGQLWLVAVYPAEPVSTVGIIGALAAAMGGGTLATVAATVIVYVAISAISMAISFAITMLLSPGRQADKSPAAADQPTSLNSLSAPTNLMRPLSRIAEIYGQMRVWPDLIFPGWSWWQLVNYPSTPFPYEGIENTKDTAEQYVAAVYCVGRGSFALSDFKFGDSDVATANGAVSIYPPGTTLPASVRMSYPVANISRLELGEAGSSTMWSPWYEIPSDEVDEVWVQVSFPQGAIYGIAGKKVYPPQTWAPIDVHITVEAERLDANGAVVETQTWATYIIGKRTRNELRLTTKHPCTRGRWRVRVADTDPADLAHKGVIFTPYKKMYLEGITGFRSLTDAERTFADETVVMVTASNRGGPATQNLERFNCTAVRVLPTQVDGATPGTLSGPTPNRKWITAAIHTLTDPKLCGYTNNEIDWASLVEVQAALEDYPAGFEEPEFNGMFDRQMSADEQLQAVARKARAIAFMSNGRITLARDQRRTGISALFNRRNRMAERGGMGLGLRLPGPDDYDGVEITWFDEDDNYRQNTYSYPEGVSLLNPLTIDLIGATKIHEVCRRARFEYAVQRYRRRTQPLRVTEEAQLLMPFDRVGIVAPWDEGVVGGEVLEIDSDSIRLDRPLPQNLSPSARIRLRSPDGRETSLHTFTSIEDEFGTGWITLDGLPSFALVVPGQDNQMGTLYNLSQSDAYDAATHWLVTGAEIDDRGVTLTLMEDNDTVYQLSDDLLDPCEGCAVAIAGTTEQSMLVPVLDHSTVQWPDDFLSPIFNNADDLDGAFRLGGALVLTGAGILAAGYYHWDWEAGLAVKFEGSDPVYLQEPDGTTTPGSSLYTAYDGVEMFTLGDGTVLAVADANLWRFDAAGGYIAGPLYGTTAFNVTLGACRGNQPQEFFQLANPPNQFVLRAWSMDVPQLTGLHVPQVAGPVVVQTVSQIAESGGIGNRLVRSGNTLGVLLGARNPSWPGTGQPYSFMSLYFYSTGLTLFSTITHIGDHPNPGPWTVRGLRPIAFHERPGGGFAVLYIDAPDYGSGYWGYSDLYTRIRFFTQDGTAAAGSFPLYVMSPLSETTYFTLGTTHPIDFAFSADGNYLVVLESANTPNGDQYMFSRLQVSVWDVSSGTAAQFVDRITVDQNPLQVDQQERQLDGRILNVGGDEFVVAFQRYESTTVYGQGGRTPIYKRQFAITRCSPCSPELVPIGEAFLIGEGAVFGSSTQLAPFGSRSFYTTFATFSPGTMWKTAIAANNTSTQTLALPADGSTSKPNTAVAVLSNGDYVVAESLSYSGVSGDVRITTYSAAGAVIAGPTNVETGFSAFGGLGGIAVVDGSRSVHVLTNAQDSSDPPIVRLRRYNADTHALEVGPVAATDANTNSNLYYQPYRGLVAVGNRLVHWYLRQPSGTFPVKCVFSVYDTNLNLLTGPVAVSDLAQSGPFEYEDAEDTFAITPLTATTFMFAWLLRPEGGGSDVNAALYTRVFDVSGAAVGASSKVYDLPTDRVPYGYTATPDGRYLLLAEQRTELVPPNGWESYKAHATLFENVAGAWVERHSPVIDYDTLEYSGLTYGYAVEPFLMPDGSLVFLFMRDVATGPGTSRTDLMARRYTIVECP